LKAPRNCTPKNGPKRRSASLPHVVEDVAQGLLQHRLVDAQVHLLARLLGLEHARGAQDLQVVGYRGPRQRGDLGDLAYGEALALLEGEQDALAVLVAQRDEHLGHRAPFLGQGAQVVAVHVLSVFMLICLTS
jgi:hypothetical protein